MKKLKNMKKAIILLTSLFFISLISILILQNIKNTNVLLSQNSNDFVNVQALVSIDNIKEEIREILLENKDNLSEYLPLSFILDIKDIKVNVILEKYEEVYNLNAILNNDTQEIKNLEKLFLNNELYYDDFSYFIKDYFSKFEKTTRISSLKQIEFILKEYSKKQNYGNIKEVKEYFSFFSIKENDNFVYASFDFTINKKEFLSKFIYDLNKAKEILNFEITFK